jgi:hypothetical protein
MGCNVIYLTMKERWIWKWIGKEIIRQKLRYKTENAGEERKASLAFPMNPTCLALSITSIYPLIS